MSTHKVEKKKRNTPYGRKQQQHSPLTQTVTTPALVPQPPSPTPTGSHTFDGNPTFEQFNFEDFLSDNARDTETDKLIEAITDAGLDDLLVSEIEHDIDMDSFVEPPADMHIMPYIVNRHVIALTLASLTSNMKSINLGFDLMSGKPCAIFADHQGLNAHKMRVSTDELFLLMKEDIHHKIENLFLSKEPTMPFQLGGIEVSLYIAKHGGKSVQLQRMGHPNINFFFALPTWKKFGQARYLIKMSLNLLNQSRPHILHFAEQFVAETVQHLQSQHVNFDTLKKLDITKQIYLIKNAMKHTSTFITVTYAQDLSMMESCHMPSIREEFTIFHFTYFQDKIMNALQNVVTTGL